MVLREPLQAQVSATGLHKLDKETVEATVAAPRYKPQASLHSSSARVQLGNSRQRPDQPRHLWKLSLNPIRFTLRKLALSACRVKYYWKYHSGRADSCTRIALCGVWVTVWTKQQSQPPTR